MNSPAVNDPFPFRAHFTERFTFYRMHLKRLLRKCQNDFDRAERVQCHRFLPTPPPTHTHNMLVFAPFQNNVLRNPSVVLRHTASESFLYVSWIVWGSALNKKKKTGITLIAVKGVSKQLWVFNTICRSAGDCVIKPVNSTSEGRTVVLIRSLLKSLDHGRADTLCSPRLSDIR